MTLRALTLFVLFSGFGFSVFAQVWTYDFPAARQSFENDFEICGVEEIDGNIFIAKTDSAYSGWVFKLNSMGQAMDSVLVDNWPNTNGFAMRKENPNLLECYSSRFFGSGTMLYIRKYDSALNFLSMDSTEVPLTEYLNFYLADKTSTGKVILLGYENAGLYPAAISLDPVSNQATSAVFKNSNLFPGFDYSYQVPMHLSIETGPPGTFTFTSRYYDRGYIFSDSLTEYNHLPFSNWNNPFSIVHQQSISQMNNVTAGWTFDSQGNTKLALGFSNKSGVYQSIHPINGFNSNLYEYNYAQVAFIDSSNILMGATVSTVGNSNVSTIPHRNEVFLVDAMGNITWRQVVNERLGLRIFGSFHTSDNCLMIYSRYYTGQSPRATRWHFQKINRWGQYVGLHEDGDVSSQINVFPNPSSGRFTMRRSDLERSHSLESTFEVLNSLGQVIHRGKLDSLNLETEIQLPVGTPQGTYFLKVVDGGSAEVVRFVVTSD